MKEHLKQIAKQILPASIRASLKAQLQGIEYCPPVGSISFGNLRRLTPISREFGYDRGFPVDRYYIENFLASHSDDIKGRVLEIGDNSYTRQFGGERVSQSDILHAVEGNLAATFVGDLTNAEQVPSDSFDCPLLTGLAVQELTPKELDFRDPNYETIVAVRAVKPEATS